MPELPEVETVRKGLEPVLSGRRIVRLEQRRPDLRFPFPERFSERLIGRRIERLNRRSKYLVAEIEGGETLIMHLGMSGRFTITLPDCAQVMPGKFEHDPGAHQKHDHAVFHTEEGTIIAYNDPRRFGFMVMTPTAEFESHPLIRDLGPEPLGNRFNAAYLAARAAGRTADLKAFLMDQRNIAGLGNIYVCEALYRSGLSPKRAARFLSGRSGAPNERTERLVAAIRAVLCDAIAAGGSSLRDYRQADGALGYFQHSFSVYGREGEPCSKPSCDAMVRRIVQAGRSTFYCPACQR
ncbi:MAG: bifunctional DNA-formamidopyrimidine glycosylase/DNA-(apurinic or apyrimidinic site) lyase [Alphaproteobacteria bacterium]|nr:bifunctional DNA-formamidopyrimidine glycosylase/DNA-(apurinic or apyrimidinic site) lyase [Alphaproteobacteria bacterium]